MEVRELGPVADGILRHREICKYVGAEPVPTWRLMHRVSAFREKLERPPYNVALSALPENLELQLNASYREAATSLRR